MPSAVTASTLAAATAGRNKIEGEGDATTNGDDGRTREKLCNDVLNTSVMAAIIGGFALSNLQQSGYDYEDSLHLAIYVCSFIAVHACTCSALTSAFVYRSVNNMPEARLEDWAVRNKWLPYLPLGKFAMGCLSYMLSVILISYRDLDGKTTWQMVTLLVGLMSMSMVFATVGFLNRHG
ncbi:unnamed protein product [Amoebophrya sp. A25]|nr:unnamed protein product [Amoebophrya sp. A25]|eukprot:GSA25T00018314001.1